MLLKKKRKRKKTSNKEFMKITYIHHSGFLVETDSCYYLFDYEKGSLPEMDVTKQIFVLSSHGHHDHYNPEIFSILNNYGMRNISAILWYPACILSAFCLTVCV